MTRILLLLGALMALAYPAQAQPVQALAVTTCGTAPITLTNGRPGPFTVDLNGNLCMGSAGGGGSVTQGTIPWVVSSYDSGAIVAAATPANSSHAAGTSNGGLFSVAVARVNGGSGILTNLGYKSVGGSTGQIVVRIWQKNPAATTCTDNVAFAGSDTDDPNLITPPFSITPAAPSSVTGDSSTYAAVGPVTWDYKNIDTSPGQNVYVCLVNVATNTADNNKVIRLTLSGPQN